MTKIETAIAAAKDGDHLRALTIFLEVFGTDDAPPLRSPKDAAGLSFFGASLALVRKEYRTAVELCKRAIDLEFYNGEHYANLARVFLAAGHRKKAVDAVESGMRVAPDHPALQEVRKQLGVRAKPTVPFLDRSHPINVSLGQTRHAKKLSEKPSKKR